MLAALGVSPIELSNKSVDQPHDKRRARVAARAELEGRFECFEENFVDRPVQVNVKPLEWAKPGKMPRAVNDFGMKASIRAGWLPEAIKSAMSACPYKVGAGCCWFVKSPDVAVLTSLFRAMDGGDVFAYHSDDASVSLRCVDGMFYANLDISSCDTSQGPAVFESMYLLCPEEYLHVMRLLVSQCQEPCQLGYGPGKLLFRPIRYFEYSGSLLTTLLNCVATFNIGRQIMERWTGGSRADAEKLVRETISSCGWSCTLETEPRIEGIQFLKTSPCRTIHGDIGMVVNLGVVLRALGQKSGEIPGHGDVKSRAREFNASLVAGMVHSGNHSLLRLLEAKFPRHWGTKAVYNSELHRRLIGGSRVVLDDMSVCRRYDITMAQYQDLLDAIEYAGFGDVICTSASSIIIMRDYGL